jgi:hypothetical protein
MPLYLKVYTFSKDIGAFKHILNPSSPVYILDHGGKPIQQDLRENVIQGDLNTILDTQSDIKLKCLNVPRSRRTCN